MNKSIKLYGFELEIDFDYQPEQKERRYMNNGDPGEPGEPEQFEIDSVFFEGKDITELVFEIENIKTTIIEKIKES
jgi:hypothetical protein